LALLRQQLALGAPASALIATLNNLERQLEASREYADEPAPTSRKPPWSPQPRKALLVEDDQNERELLATLLRLSGLEVDTAGDGLDALDYLHTHDRPDVVLLDMGLPRCDGPTTVRAIRSDPTYAGLPIFAVTGHSPGYFDLEMGDGGVDRWFNKPLNAEALLSDLGRLPG
jgi:CheY-like chemotaxis protein